MVNFSTKIASTVSVAALLATTLSSSVVSAASEFLPYAELLADNDVIGTQSTEAGYRLGDTVTRAELAKVAANLGGYTPTDCVGTYADVTSSLGDLCGYVEALEEAGVVASATNFRPTASVTRAEMVKMLLGVVGEEPSTEDAGYMDIAGLGDLAGYINRANELGCAATASYFRPNATASRGEAFKIAACVAGLEPITDEETTDEETTDGDTTTTVGGDLTVAIAGSAMAQYVPKNAAGINVGALKLTAGSEDVAVSSITVARSGLGDKNDINEIYASVNGVINNNGSYSTSTEQGIITFSPALVVKAGTSTEVQVLVSLEADSAANSQHQFTVKSVASNASSATGTPVTLGLINTTSATVAEITVQTAGSSSTYRVGDKGVEIGQFKIVGDTANDEDVKVHSVTFRNNGDGDMVNNLANVALYVNGVKVSTSATVSGKNLTVALDDTVLYGRTNTYYLRADITGVDDAAGDSYQFTIRNTTDISATEVSTGFGVNVTGPSVALESYSVKGGDVVLTRDTTVSTTATVAPGANDVVLLAGNISVAGAITLEDLTLDFTKSGTNAASGTLANTFSLLKLVVDGVTVSTATPSGSATSAEFNGKFTVTKNSTIRVVGNVRSTAPQNVTWKSEELGYNDFIVAEYVSNGNSIDSTSFVGSIAGVSASVGTASITLSQNSGVSDQNVVAGAQNLLLGRYNVTATDTSAVNVTKLKFTNSGSLTMSGGSNSSLTAVKLIVGGTVVSTKTFSAGNADFNDVTVTVPKNGSTQIEVRGDFSTIASGTFKLALESANVTAVDSNSTTLASTDIKVQGTAPTYTFVSAGSADILKNSSSPTRSIITAGSNLEVARITFSAEDDDLVLRDLYLQNTGSATLGSVVSTATLEDEAGTVLSNGTVVGNTIYFALSDNAFSIPKNTSSRYAKVKLAISSDAITDAQYSNKTIELQTGIAGTDFEAVSGVTEGARFVSKSTGNDVTAVDAAEGTSVANIHLVTRSTIVVAAPTTGDFSRQSFTVTAGANNRVYLSGITFTTNVAGLAGTIYKDSVTAGNEVGTVTTQTGSANVVVFTNSGVEISAGTTKTFYVDYSNVTSSTQGTSIRTFKITDAAFIDVMNTGGNVTVNSVSAYNNAGVPSTEQKSTY